MQISLVGLMVCLGLLGTAYAVRGVVIVSFIASLAFGSTALMTISSLGSSSPLVYTLFCGLVISAAALRRRILRDLGMIFGMIRPMWVMTGLMLYTVVGAWLFPRLFAGQTSVFVQSKTRFGVVEASLAPVSGNISQTGYFVLGCLTALALCVLLSNLDRMRDVRRGIFLWCGLHVGMGLIDFCAKLVGAGDILAPIRTASYAMVTNVTEAGFSRIVGAYSEASAFGGVSLACLAFCYTYWRMTRSRSAGALFLILLFLLILSTSATAYVGLAILAIPAAVSIARSMVRGRMEVDELLMVALASSAVMAVVGISLYKAGFFDPFLRLLDTAIINKASSSSGQERTYWNVKSLQSFMDTSGLGIGFGSSRASSWPIAVLSQLGLVGSVMMGGLLIVVVAGLGRLRVWVDPETDALVASIRNCALASVVSASVAGGSANPGMIFFIAFAVICTGRVHARRQMNALLVHRHNRHMPTPASTPQLLGYPA